MSSKTWVRGAGGLSEGITALQQLARLRLQNVLTAPLIHTVSELTKLTSIALCSEDYSVFGGPVRPCLLPDAATALTALRHLDIDGINLPPALEALTGMHLLISTSNPQCAACKTLEPDSSALAHALASSWIEGASFADVHRRATTCHCETWALRQKIWLNWVACATWAGGQLGFSSQLFPADLFQPMCTSMHICHGYICVHAEVFVCMRRLIRHTTCRLKQLLSWDLQAKLLQVRWILLEWQDPGRCAGPHEQRCPSNMSAVWLLNITLPLAMLHRVGLVQ